MTLASGVGSHPGDDQRDFDEAVRLVLGELPGACPTCPRCPAAAPTASMTGRALAVMAELGADLQPAGWRLTGRAAASTTAGPAACSPRTSTGWRSRRRGTPARSRSRSPDRGRWRRPSSGRAGTRCSPTSAPGASSRRRWPRGSPSTSPTCAAGCRARHRMVVQVDEPALTAVLAGAVPTASGFGRHRTVHPPEASQALGWVLDAITRRGRRAVGALVRRRHAARPAPGRGRRGTLGRPRAALGPRPRRARRGARGGADGRARRRTVDRPGDSPDRRPGHRGGAALAGDARPRPGPGRRPAGADAGVRPGGRLAGVDPDRARADSRAPPTSTRSSAVTPRSRRATSDESVAVVVRPRRARPPGRRWPAPGA